MHSRVIDVSYGQIALFDSRLQQPFNDWADGHVAQGFAWRPGSVSFSTLREGGSLETSLIIGEFSTTRTIERAIVVPFSVPDHGEIEIASISQSCALAVKPGEYRLTFFHGLLSEDAMWATFSLQVALGPVVPQIVIAGGALRPPQRFLMTAQPA